MRSTATLRRTKRLSTSTVSLPGEAAWLLRCILVLQITGAQAHLGSQEGFVNARKYGVSFEAATCIDAPRACYLRNEAPSYEDRLILIAVSSKRRLLFVVHAEVGRDAIRITQRPQSERRPEENLR